VMGIIAGIIIAGLAITFVAANMFVTQEQKELSNPRTVSWRHVHGLGIDPSDRTILYIATHGDFYQSISGAPPVKVDEKRADYMAFNAPSTPGYPLYSSGHPETGGNTGLIKSTDGGKTWQLVSNVLESPVDFHVMAVSKSDPNLILGFDSGGRGLFKTIDSGKTWETLGYPEYISALAIAPNDSNTIFAGTGNGIYKSTDGGKTWNHLTYKGLTVSALAFDEDDILFASVNTFGFVKSSDFGDSWEDLQDLDLNITSIAADSQNKVIYIAGYSSGGFQEVYKIPYDLNSYELIGTNKVL
ncbi:MAG: F510_1955 family glycosylhydrolase, partial [Nitrosarchaeum sp.]